MESSKVIPFDDAQIAVIGLGYVGLPLAVEFGKTSAGQSASTSVPSRDGGIAGRAGQHPRGRPPRSWAGPDFRSVSPPIPRRLQRTLRSTSSRCRPRSMGLQTAPICRRLRKASETVGQVAQGRGRYRDLRKSTVLPRRDGGGLRPRAGARVRPDLQ